MEHKPFKCKQPKITRKGAETWGRGVLVRFPVSYSYNGGIVIGNEWYSGYEVPPPKIPKGYYLKSIGIGLQLNARPPYATQLLLKK